MLGQRQRRWPNIGTTLGRCLVFAGMPYLYQMTSRVLFSAQYQTALHTLCLWTVWSSVYTQPRLQTPVRPGLEPSTSEFRRATPGQNRGRRMYSRTRNR